MRILFVCHGNICRSPMAEFLFQRMLAEKGLEDAVTVASGATSCEEIVFGRGNPVYPPARAELRRHGISCDGKRAVQVQKSDYERYDRILAMDSANLCDVKKIFGGDPEGKVCKLLDLVDGGDVADPWYTDDFATAYADIERGCFALLAEILPDINKERSQNAAI